MKRKMLVSAVLFLCISILCYLEMLPSDPLGIPCLFFGAYSWLTSMAMP